MFFTNESNEKSKFSFIKGLTYPVMIINDHIGMFLLLTCFFCFIASLVSFLLGRLFLCGFADADIGVSCSINILNIIVSVFVNLLLISFYLTRISVLTGKHEKKNWFLQSFGWKKELKSLFLLGCYLLFWGIVICLGGILVYRHPTSDWVVELGFFVACSLGIVFALVLLINFSCFLNFLHGGHLSVIKKSFWFVFDEIFKIFFWFFIYMIIFVFLFNDTIRYFIANMNMLNMVMAEFCFYFLLFLMIAIVYFSYEYQEKVLFVEEK